MVEHTDGIRQIVQEIFTLANRPHALDGVRETKQRHYTTLALAGRVAHL